MPSPRTVFVCQNCGYASPRWLGRCPECGTWNQFVEEKPLEKEPKVALPPPEVVPLRGPLVEVAHRRSTGLSELDRALGGGLVAGSVTLLGGEPGAGKSTLALQLSALYPREGEEVLYVAGEESPQQVQMRARRIGAAEAPILVLGTSRVEDVETVWEDRHPALVVVDSIQTLASADFASPPGSVGQVRAVAARLIQKAKETQVPLLLVGHINKEGLLAGPKVLEHAVDTVLYFEGERHGVQRIVRATKNRFGPVGEIGCFEMGDKGLREVANPSAWFLTDAEEGSWQSGMAVTAAAEGSRPLLVEVQALLVPARYGPGRRTVTGFDPNRLALLLAVLERRLGWPLAQEDAFLKVVGGLKVEEPAMDLAVALALVSSHLHRPLPRDWVIFGEVGLGGEIRPVARAESRVKEAGRLGFQKVLLPWSNAKELAGWSYPELLPVRHLKEAVGLSGLPLVRSRQEM
ncbi:MAG: DNA repair protein RadA [Clostridiales bacterium]|nr:DNA repair protein RadA [Clostridiales bacterium]